MYSSHVLLDQTLGKPLAVQDDHPEDIQHRLGCCDDAVPEHVVLIG